MNKTIALVGETGSGKTSQIGQLAKALKRDTNRRTLLFNPDMGGTNVIAAHITLGLIEPRPLRPDQDPWLYIMHAASGVDLPSDVGLVAFDSATTMSELLLSACAKQASEGKEVGGKAAKLRVQSGDTYYTIGTNTESHYMAVQNYILDAIWRSTWLTERGVDVLWTFGLHRGEGTESAVTGPATVGKAQVSKLPKNFNYTFRIVAVPQQGALARHILHLDHQPDNNGLSVSFSNSRYPLDAVTPLPATLEPADLAEAFRLIHQGEEEAEAALRRDMNL